MDGANTKAPAIRDIQDDSLKVAEECQNRAYAILEKTIGQSGITDLRKESMLAEPKLEPVSVREKANEVLVRLNRVMSTLSEIETNL